MGVWGCETCVEFQLGGYSTQVFNVLDISHLHLKPITLLFWCTKTSFRTVYKANDDLKKLSSCLFTLEMNWYSVAVIL